MKTMKTMETINYQEQQELQYQIEYDEYKAYQLYMFEKLTNKMKRKNCYTKLYLLPEEATFLFQNPEIKPDHILIGQEGKRYYLY